jgi:hypothetical protein
MHCKYQHVRQAWIATDKGSCLVCKTACGAPCCSASASVSKQQQRLEFCMHAIPQDQIIPKPSLRMCTDSEALLRRFLALEQRDIHTRAANSTHHAAHNNAPTADSRLNRHLATIYQVGNSRLQTTRQPTSYWQLFRTTQHTRSQHKQLPAILSA